MQIVLFHLMPYADLDLAEGRKICIEVLRDLAEIPGVAGAHVMAPMNFAEIPNVIVESGVAGKKLPHAVH